jgi:hypothetical protein
MARQALEQARSMYPIELPVREQNRVPIDIFNSPR